jgi:transposase-like protein
MGRKRRGAEEKARIALEALREDRPVREVAEQYGVHPNQMTTWKRQLLDNAGNVLRNGVSVKSSPPVA